MCFCICNCITLVLVGLYLYTRSEQWVVGKVKVSSLVGVGASHTHGTLLSHIMTKIVLCVFFPFIFSVCLGASHTNRTLLSYIMTDNDCSICVFPPLNFTSLFGSLPYHTCKKRVMLRGRLFWPKKNCGKSA